MAMRARPRLLDDRFGSTTLGTYNDKPALSNAPRESPTLQHVPNLTVPQALEVISILLLDYQCKGKVIDTHSDTSFRIWFPFAWHTIRIGDTIKNLSIGEQYVVEEIITNHSVYKKNYVVVRGKTQPKPFHIMRFDNRRSELVGITPAYPDTESKPYEFTSDGYLQLPENNVWTDVITYCVVAEAPGSMSGQIFGGGRQEMSPRYRETVQEDGQLVKYSGQAIDTRVRFDFWTQTNSGSERFREWFRDFTYKYGWLIEKNGVGRFIWHSSGAVSTATRWKNSIIHRSAFYDFRTEYSIYEELFKIRSGDVQVVVPGDNNNDVSISYNF